MKKFFSLFKLQDPVESYLNSSGNMYELERRMKEIDRGHAPFQRYTKAER